MKKIALLHYAYPPSMGGAELLTQEQANVLSHLGYDVLVLTGNGEEANEQIRFVVEERLQSILQQDRALQERFVGQGIIDEEFVAISSEVRAILDEYLADRDVIIVHNMATLIHNLPFLKAFKEFVKDRPEKRVIIWAHDQTYIDDQAIKYDKEGVNLSEEQKALLLTPIPGAVYVTISETFARLFSQIMGIPFEKLQIIPNGINLKRFFTIDDAAWELLKSEQILEAYPLIFSPVNILQRKNLLYGLEIIAELKKTYPNVKYVITGKPSVHRSIKDHFEKLQEKIAELKLQGNVIFLKEKLSGTVPHTLVNAFYSLSDAVFYFSKQENFGLPILESMLLKTPIFVSDLPVFHEIAGDLITYIDYKSVTPDKAAELIVLQLTQDKEGKLHTKVREDYDLETVVTKRLIPLFS